MLGFRLVYSPGYDLHLGQHVFPAQKYRLIVERLRESGLVSSQDLITPQPATDADMLLAHTEDWIKRLKSGQLTFEEAIRLEIPYRQETIDAFWLLTGGTILAARHALEDSIGFNIGGGFHHAYAGHGEGFCAVNDVAVAARRLRADGLIQRALVADCDVHHGNGTAAIFAEDESVYTLSIHQLHNYPEIKPASNLDIHLEDHTGDEEYLAKLDAGYRTALETSKPEIVFYVAGADPYHQDQLGGLALTIEGLKRRDRLVIEGALDRRIPVCVTLAGGYARAVGDTVTIHCNTARVCAEALGFGW